MNRQELLISIVVAVYNGAKTLQHCIDSVINQTYPHKELIIIDGGSTDGTADILKKNWEKIIYWESKPDRGIAHAWNKALKGARGDWIVFLGADDSFASPTIMAEVIPILISNPDIDIVVGKAKVLSSDGRIIREWGRPWQWQDFRRRMRIAHPGAFHSKELFSEIGYFNESFTIACDYELLLRKGPRLKTSYINKVLSCIQQGGLSQRELGRVLKERERAQVKNKALCNLSAVCYNYWSLIKFFGLRFIRSE